jgi:hypothetical protein
VGGTQPSSRWLPTPSPSPLPSSSPTTDLTRDGSHPRPATPVTATRHTSPRDRPHRRRTTPATDHTRDAPHPRRTTPATHHTRDAPHPRPATTPTLTPHPNRIRTLLTDRCRLAHEAECPRARNLRATRSLIGFAAWSGDTPPPRWSAQATRGSRYGGAHRGGNGGCGSGDYWRGRSQP